MHFRTMVHDMNKQNLIQAINDIQRNRKTATQQIGAVDTAVLQEIGGGRTAALMRTSKTTTSRYYRKCGR